jgi:hypothetical protein
MILLKNLCRKTSFLSNRTAVSTALTLKKKLQQQNPMYASEMNFGKELEIVKDTLVDEKLT